MSVDPSPQTGGYGLSDYLAVIKRRWMWLGYGLLAGLGAALLVTGITSPSYVAKASVLVESAGVDATSVTNSRTTGDINLDTEAALVVSEEISDRARDLLGSSKSAAELADAVQVTVPPNSQIMVISFEASSPNAAQQGAQAFADAYLESRADLAQQDVDAEVEQLRSQLESLNTALADVSETLNDLPDDETNAFAESRQTVLTSRIAEVNAKIEDLLTTDHRAGRIITPASQPQNPSGPSRELIYGSGLALGLLLGAILLFVRERTDSRLLSPNVATPDTKLRALGVLPQITPWANRRDEKDAYDRLRNVLMAATKDQPIIVISGVDGHTPTRGVTERLADRLATTDRRVVVIDATAAGEYAPPPGERGLSDVLMDGDWAAGGLDGQARKGERFSSGVIRIGAGTRPDLVRHLLAAKPAVDTMQLLRNQADATFIVAPADDIAITQTLANLADGVVYVATIRQSRRTDVVDSVNWLSQVNAVSIGLIAVDHPPLAVSAIRSLRHRLGGHDGAEGAPAAASTPRDALRRAEPRRDERTDRLEPDRDTDADTAALPRVGADDDQSEQQWRTRTS